MGGYALTLIDALDTLALLGNKTEFARGVRWVANNVNFEIDKTVSLFETNIRIMGGLLAAHLLAGDPATGVAVPGYGGELLALATDLGDRLLPAFHTPTGIPYGSINLIHGVAPNETTVTSTAAGGTLALEFGSGRASCCSPRRRMPFNSMHRGFKCVPMKWRATCARP